jgi:hypothetical protein
MRKHMEIEALLEAIKTETRENLGRRFRLWIKSQRGWYAGSWTIWKVSEERAVREIAESILLSFRYTNTNPDAIYFAYEDDILMSAESDRASANVLEIDTALFMELYRDCKLKELGI